MYKRNEHKKIKWYSKMVSLKKKNSVENQLENVVLEIAKTKNNKEKLTNEVHESNQYKTKWTNRLNDNYTSDTSNRF